MLYAHTQAHQVVSDLSHLAKYSPSLFVPTLIIVTLISQWIINKEVVKAQIVFAWLIVFLPPWVNSCPQEIQREGNGDEERRLEAPKALPPSSGDKVNIDLTVICLRGNIYIVVNIGLTPNLKHPLMSKHSRCFLLPHDTSRPIHKLSVSFHCGFT